MFYAISGNHDQYTKNYIHKPSISYAAGLANTLENFILLDLAGAVLDNNVGIYGIPYLYLNQNFEEAIIRATNFFKKHKVDKSILLIHTTIEGSVDTNGYKVTESSILLEMLEERFTLVLAGHIHKHQKMGKGVYHVGAGVHVKASDAGYEPVYVKILNPLNTRNLRVRTVPIEDVKIFKYYNIPDEKVDEPNTMWVFKAPEQDEAEVTRQTVDLTDFPKLMKGYLKALKVKSPLRKNIAMNILKEVMDDTAD
jgi:DNA repair exonuclease SbcCD nuclease subunit